MLDSSISETPSPLFWFFEQHFSAYTLPFFQVHSPTCTHTHTYWVYTHKHHQRATWTTPHHSIHTLTHNEQSTDTIFCADKFFHESKLPHSPSDRSSRVQFHFNSASLSSLWSPELMILRRGCFSTRLNSTRLNSTRLYSTLLNMMNQLNQ